MKLDLDGLEVCKIGDDLCGVRARVDTFVFLGNSSRGIYQKRIAFGAQQCFAPEKFWIPRVVRRSDGVVWVAQERKIQPMLFGKCTVALW